MKLPGRNQYQKEGTSVYFNEHKSKNFHYIGQLCTPNELKEFAQRWFFLYSHALAEVSTISMMNRVSGQKIEIRGDDEIFEDLWSRVTR